MSCLIESTSDTSVETTSIHFVNAGSAASIDEERYDRRLALLKNMQEEPENEPDSEGGSEDRDTPVESIFDPDPYEEAEKDPVEQWFSLTGRRWL